MRKTLDLLTIIRKLNHPMIKQVNSQSPKYKYSLTRLCITFTQNVITDQNIFFSPKVRSWHQRYDGSWGSWDETEFSQAGLDSWVWWQVSWSTSLYDNQRFCIIKRVYSWVLRRTQEFTWEMLGSQWQWGYHNYRHMGQRIRNTFSLSLCPPKTCTRM